ncbi:MAG: hypothetical protein GF398_21875 [Chitinivibrionales bacterium]|nr:hypothetical protein [Chitinivibrionales bacterium]
MLLNTHRGAQINTVVLIDGLKRGRTGRATLDVYVKEEYFFKDRSEEIIDDELLARFLSFPNVLITSHQGFFTREAMYSIAQTTLGDITYFFREGQLPNEVS